MDLEKLKAPFAADAYEWRIGQSGKTRDGRPWAKVLVYVTNRAIMDRLDEVCGPAGWKNEYAAAPNADPGKAVLCGISILVPVRTGVETATGDPVYGRAEWLTKWDGADNTDFEATKGGLSDSMKRAAVQWGIGRHLYNVGESWADCTEESMRGQPGWRYAKTKDGTFWWTPPALPAWALPEKDAAKEAAIRATDGRVQPASRMALPPKATTKTG